MNKSASYSRNIKVFLSSTFQDMEDVRNYLVRKTFPKLREKAVKYGVSITELDLRWGIQDNETKLGNVLQLCFEEVDNSMPFFIGIVGKRYGWIPSLKDINANAMKLYPEIEGYLNNEISITEMEMRYGALSRPDYINAMFFVSAEEPIRTEDLEGYDKLMALRAKLKENGKYPVYTYQSVEDIAVEIESFIDKLLKEQFDYRSDNPIINELYSQLLYAEMQSSNIVLRKDIREKISEWIQTPSNVLLLRGESGIGKNYHTCRHHYGSVYS